MKEKLDLLDVKLDKLYALDGRKFVSEEFKEINSQIKILLLEIKSNKFILEKNKFSEDYLNIFNNILKKIDRLETKI